MSLAAGTLLAVAAVLVVSCRPAQVELGPPPNVLLLVIDCLRPDHLSANGYERATTPTLDALAAESLVFTRAISQAPWTRPSLPTLLTGLYPSEHGLHSFDQSSADVVESPRLGDSTVTLAESLKERGYVTALIGEQFQLSRRFGLAQGFDIYHNRVSGAVSIHRMFLKWLQDTPSRPFFAYLHYLDIHWPYCPPPRVRGTFNEGRSKLRFCNKWRELRKAILDGEITLTEGDRQALEARYDEELLALDQNLAKLFAALRERGLWDDTLIVVTSDHGEEFFERGRIGHGHSLYQELIAVPLIFKPPAAWPATPGRRIEELAEVRQVTPTVLAAAGAPPLADSTAPSLIPWMTGRAPRQPPQPFVVSEMGSRTALLADSLKLIFHQEGELELYDLASDPGETRNLVDESHRDVRRMLAHLAAWREQLRPAANVEVLPVDPETVEGLRALGYLD